MAVLKFYHKKTNRDSIEIQRLITAKRLSPLQRWKMAFELISLSVMFKKNRIFFKQPEGMGIVLRQNKRELI